VDLGVAVTTVRAPHLGGLVAVAVDVGQVCAVAVLVHPVVGHLEGVRVDAGVPVVTVLGGLVAVAIRTHQKLRSRPSPAAVDT
jgi:hypothetical protein